MVNPGTVEAPGGTLSLAITPFYLGNAAARFIIQPRAGTKFARVPVLLTYTGDAPTSIHARAVDSATGLAIPGADWIQIEDMVVDPVAKTVRGYLPGVRVGAENNLQARLGNKVSVSTSSTQKWTVGPRTIIAGQSNQVMTLDGNTTYASIVPGSTKDERAYWAADTAGSFFGLNGPVAISGVPGDSGSNSMGSSAIQLPNTAAGGGLALLRIVGAMLQNSLGRKAGVGLTSWAIGGTSISQYLAGGNLNVIMSNSGTTAGAIGFSSPEHYGGGDYQIVDWMQGETEVGTLTVDQRFNDLVALCQMHHAQVAPFGRTPAQLTIMFAVPGVYSNVAHAEILRAAVYKLIAHGKALGWDVRISRTHIDLDPAGNDGLHLYGNDMKIANRRLVQSVMNAVDPVAVPYSGEGPHFTGAYTRSGDDITVTVAHNGGTALAAKNPALPITGIYANTLEDFSGTDIVVTNVAILPGAQVRFTVTGAPATFWWKHCGGKLKTAQSYHPDVSNLIFDDFVYPTGAHPGDQCTGRPVHETPTAYKVGP